jgi:hypothetical protein
MVRTARKSAVLAYDAHAEGDRRTHDADLVANE